MISDDVIVKNEFLNDGSSIHIYVSGKYNCFVAFGFIEGKYYHIQSSAKMDNEAYSEWAQWLHG